MQTCLNCCSAANASEMPRRSGSRWAWPVQARRRRPRRQQLRRRGQLWQPGWRGQQLELRWAVSRQWRQQRPQPRLHLWCMPLFKQRLSWRLRACRLSSGSGGALACKQGARSCGCLPPPLLRQLRRLQQLRQRCRCAPAALEPPRPSLSMCRWPQRWCRQAVWMLVCSTGGMWAAPPPAPRPALGWALWTVSCRCAGGVCRG